MTTGSEQASAAAYEKSGDEGILLLANRIGAALETCQSVERNPEGWGGPMAVSLARTIRRDLTGEDLSDVDY